MGLLKTFIIYLPFEGLFLHFFQKLDFSMRLRSLEIKGFKSFANETIVNFNHNVIGIVGPNGSGKSNIVDAIRWVLGEQKNTELRLDKMNSVIFNGTKKRKAAQVASVTLTFDNTKNILPSEYAQVAITRMLYASGESEYRLNGVTCRLKDITNLFLDTGVGSNSYAIIALSMVDDILNDKLNYRRTMLEQAAGVSKYKNRKNETQNKLAATDEDLNRVEDLLFEINQNLKKLEKQASHAKKYLDIKKQYRQFSIELVRHKLSENNAQLTANGSQHATQADSLRVKEIAATNIETALERDKLIVLQGEQLLSEKQRELNKVVATLRETENKRNAEQQRGEYIQQNIKRLNESISQSDQKKKTLNGEITNYNSQLQVQEQKLTVLNEELAALNVETVRASSLLQNFASSQQTDQELLKNRERILFDAEKNFAVISANIQNIKAESKYSEEKNATLKREVLETETTLSQLKSEKIKLETQLFEIKETETSRRQNLEIAQSELETVSSDLALKSRTFDAKKNALKLQRSMVENLEGFPDSIKFLSQHAHWIKAPLLSDIIYVPENYRTAIETFLEPFLNYYVVNTEAEALAAVQLLTQSQKGKAQFFILSKISTEQSTFNFESSFSFIKAIDCVQFEPQYTPLIQNLLANVFIVSTEQEMSHCKNALEDSRVNPYAVANINGTTLFKNYSLQGGSIGLFDGKKIGRKKSLEILEKEINAAEKEIKELEQKQKELKTISEASKVDGEKINASLLPLNAHLNTVNQKFFVLENNTTQKKNALQDLSSNATTLLEKIKNFETQRTELEKIILESKKEIVVLDTKRNAFTRELEILRNNAQQASSAFNEKNIQFLQWQNTVKFTQRERDFRMNQLTELQNGLVSAEKNIQEEKIKLAQAQEIINTCEIEIAQLYSQRKEKQSFLNASEQSFFQKKNEVHASEDTLRKLNREIQNEQQSLSQLKEKIQELKYQITGLIERVGVEFQIAENEINTALPTSTYDLPELERKVGTLKKQLENFGEINPLALEAFDEMKTRHDTIAAQRDDILAAKKSLLETISEIEQIATANFIEAFEQVRASFIEVFKSLFHEDDSADLVLSNPDAALESSINIVAKPKGKRPQSISQLSGGEKTLTAIAFLFALYLYKPAPFCIFDEVDAPLDDANIQKFNNVIQKFSKESQFIVITHNKSTMAAVDVMYGVYMAEQGVSDVIPVDFRNYEHKPVEMSTLLN